MKLTNLSYVKEIMQKYDLVFHKKYGQNFLIQEAVPERIAEECGADEKGGILEIGPGIGTLSQKLCQVAKKVVAVEIDADLIPVLEETMSEFDHFKVIRADVMKTDLAALVKEEFAGMPVSVCANLPYYITTPILMKLLESKIGFDYITVMIQKEVAERLCAEPGEDAYGAITVSLAYYGKAERLFDVSPGSFVPPPKVKSSVVRIRLYKQPPVTVKKEDILFRCIKGAFEQRRKTLQNALSSQFPYGKDLLAQAISQAGLDVNVRGERLSLEQFALLSDQISLL